MVGITFESCLEQNQGEKNQTFASSGLEPILGGQ